MSLKQSKYRKMLRLQEAKEWDLESDIHWENHRKDLPLLPHCDEFAEKFSLTKKEQLVFSQFLGLMAVKAISQHEQILASVQQTCWRRPLQKRDANADYIELGEQFFKEEAKHSRAFAKYIDVFAEKQNLNIEKLNSILPKYSHSWLARIFKLNSILGGRAIWWLVMITEEESLSLFRSIRAHKSTIDPLFYELNELHYQEEIRHTSYAPLMIRELTRGRRNIFFKLDYILAMSLHKIWIGAQIRRLKKISKIKGQHPFFVTLVSIYKKFNRLSLGSRVATLRNDIPFLSQLFYPTRHRAIAIELQRNPDLFFMEKGAHHV